MHIVAQNKLTLYLESYMVDTVTQSCSVWLKIYSVSTAQPTSDGMSQLDMTNTWAGVCQIDKSNC